MEENGKKNMMFPTVLKTMVDFGGSMVVTDRRVSKVSIGIEQKAVKLLVVCWLGKVRCKSKIKKHFFFCQIL